jgi:3-hydroxyacyl-CoA dehydrogenase
MVKPIQRITIIGTGVIGASWAALFLAKGLDVVATDIAPDAKKKLDDFIAATWPALEQLGLAPGASPSKLQFTDSFDAAVAGGKRSDAFRCGRGASWHS